MLAALQLAAANLQTDMLRLVVFVGALLLLPPLSGLLLARTTALSALVPTAVKLSSAHAEAKRMLDVSLMASGLGRCPSAPAGDFDSLGARRARTSVAFIQAQVATSQNLIAWLVAVRDEVLTRSSWLHG